jgi:hypothetical protein
MAADEQRTETQIRGEIAREREQLVLAVDGLREGIRSKRRAAAVVAVAVPVVVATAALVRWRLRRG